MSDAMRAVGDDEPVMIAWKAHKETPDFANSKKWAAFPEHLDGSLWALFSAGFSAGQSTTRPRAQPKCLMRRCLMLCVYRS